MHGARFIPAISPTHPARSHPHRRPMLRGADVWASDSMGTRLHSYLYW